MSKLDFLHLSGTTDSSGDLTVTSTTRVTGKLIAVQWVDGTFADGVDAVLSFTEANTAVSVTLLTLTDANADAWYYPLVAAHDNAGAAVTFDGTNEVYTNQIINGVLKLVVSSGGDEASGGCVVYFSQGD